MKKMTKKIISCIVSLAIFAAMMPAGFAFADDFDSTAAAEAGKNAQQNHQLSGKTVSAEGDENRASERQDSLSAGKTVSAARSETSTYDKIQGQSVNPDENDNEKTVSETGKVNKTTNETVKEEQEKEIILNKPVVSDVAVAKNHISLYWTKDTKCDGYKIVFAENSAFSKNKKEFVNTKNSMTSRIISGTNKSKRYYVKICEYKIITYTDPETGKEVKETVDGKYSKTVSLRYLRPWKKCTEIKHACGKIGGKTYTNSLEALKKSLLKNSPAIEIDFDFTCDGKLVCTHGFDGFRKKPTYKQFMAKKIAGKYTPMTAETALKLMSYRFNSYLVMDCKGTAAPVFREINRILKDNKLGYYRQNIVPQIYYVGDYKSVKKIYNYKNWIFTTYKLKMKTIRSYVILIKFCKKRGIKTITIPVKRAKKKQIRLLNKAKCMVGIHTVKTLREYVKFRKAGGKFIYSDI